LAHLRIRLEEGLFILCAQMLKSKSLEKRIIGASQLKTSFCSDVKDNKEEKSNNVEFVLCCLCVIVKYF
jgi:hypothetical protein